MVMFVCAFLHTGIPLSVFYFKGRRAAHPVVDGGIRMSLKISSSEVDGVSLIALNGRIVLGEESNALREKLKSLIAGEKKKIS